VVIEKPLAASTADAKVLCDLATETGCVLMVDHLLLYHPGVEELKRRVVAGDLGDLNYIYAQRLNLGVVRQEENVLWSLGAHDIAVAIDLIGSSPIGVSAHGGLYLQPEKRIYDVAFVNILFAGGRRAHLHLSWLDPGKVRKITVVGSDKMAVFDDMEPTSKLSIHDKGVTMVAEDRSPQARYGDITVPTVALDEPLKQACAHFLACAESGATPRSDGWAGLDVVRVLEAAQTSMDEERILRT
jgi:predicted dehydrogenase